MKELKVIRALLPFFRRYPWAIPAVVVLGTLASLAEGLGVGLFIPFLQSFGQESLGADGSGWFAPHVSKWFEDIPPDQRIVVICACIFGTILLKALLTFACKSLYHWLNSDISYRLRSAIFDQLLTVSHRFLERSQSGKLINVLAAETERTSLALQYFFDIIVAMCATLVLSVMLLLISWKLTLLVAAVLLSISAVSALTRQSQRRLGTRFTAARSELTNRVVQCIAGMKVVRSFGREDYEAEEFDRASRQVFRTGMISGIVGEGITPLYEVLVGALLVAILIATGRDLATLPTVLVFVFMLFRLQPRVIEIDGRRVRLASMEASIEAVTSLISREGKPYLQAGSTPFKEMKEGIRFDHVTYRYSPEDDPALKDVDIVIPAGKTTALVGPSGGGKSTLINLVLRLYDPDSGQVCVDQTPLPELDLQSWRSRIAIVSQDVFVFNTTIRDNIAYARPEATDEEIVAAARLAEADGFISRFPDGYDTIIGERGARLSGGQNQRITLARAILRDPDILILDEATNALDSIAENLIQDALDRLGQNRTVIVVAHRLSTVERADHIVVLEDGRVCEQGDRSQLLEMKGLFSRLHELQHRGVVS